ncbi:MAG: hypothetical protein R2744_02770 [Bacteroidales bacterium]
MNLQDEAEPGFHQEGVVENGYTLHLFNPVTGDTVTYPFVTSYRLADKSPGIIFTSTGMKMVLNRESTVITLQPVTLQIFTTAKPILSRLLFQMMPLRAAFCEPGR